MTERGAPTSFKALVGAFFMYQNYTLTSYRKVDTVSLTIDRTFHVHETKVVSILMVISETEQQLIEELIDIEKRLKGRRTMSELRRLLSSLKRVDERIERNAAFIRFRLLFLRGVLYTKAATLNSGGWIASSVESLQYAIEQHDAAYNLITELMQHPSDNLGVLVSYQRACVYEAAVAATTLLSWGEQPDIWPYTGCLSDEVRNKIVNAQRHRKPLVSRY